MRCVNLQGTVLTIELPKRTPEDKEKAAKVIEVK